MESSALSGTYKIRHLSSVFCPPSEAWHKRRYEAHFVSKLTDADAEQAETQHWLDTALACKVIKPDCHHGLIEKCRQIGRMLGSMINKPSTFCRQSIK
jgi:four helix bundle protein